MRRRALALVLCATGLLAGCQPVDEEGSNACMTNSECPLGRVCNALEGQCINEVSDGFVGTFSCTVIGANDVMPDSGLTDVVGYFGGNRYALNRQAVCVMQGAALNVFLTTYLPSGDRLYAVLVFNSPGVGLLDAAGGEMDLEPSGGDAVMVGKFVDGLAQFYSQPAPGARLSAWTLFGFAPIQ